MGGRYVVALALVLALAFSPASALAAALSDAQIQSILSLLSAFGADASVVTSVSAALRGQPTNAPSPGTATTPGSICAQVTELARGLTEGSNDAATNGAVTRLQTLLATDASIYPERMVTGYFGSLTTTALRRCGVGAGTVIPSNSGRTPAPACTWRLQNSTPDPGEKFTISWTSTNATSVTGSDGTVYEPNDEVTITATTPGTTEYPFTFTGPGGIALCRVSVTVLGTSSGTPLPVLPKVSGTIDTASLTQAAKTVRGTVKGSTEVLVYLYENGGIFTSGKVVVVDGAWVFTPAIAFTKGATYTVYLYSYPGSALLVKKDFLVE